MIVVQQDRVGLCFSQKTFIIVFIDFITIPPCCMKVSQQRQPNPLNNKNCAQKTMHFKAKYKTQKCRYLIERGYCPFGDMCAFAHDGLQIRNKAVVHAHYKTRPCLNFSKTGYCRYGDRCLFQHSEERDRERTRSNSPNENEQPQKSDTKFRHQNYLKILSNYGFGAFQAYLNRKQSKIVQWITCSEATVTKVSENQCEALIDDHSTMQWNSGWNDKNQQTSNFGSERKIRMYSL